MNFTRQLCVVVVLVLNTISTSCCNFIVDGNTSNYIWKTSIANAGLIFGDVPIMIHEKGCLFVGDKNGTSVLYFLDKANGNILWEWSDFIQSKEILAAQDPYIYQNTLCIQSLNGGIYIIDILTGKTIRKTPDKGSSLLSGVGSSFFYTNNLSSIFQYSFVDGQNKEITSLPPRSGLRVGFDSPRAFVGTSGDTLITAFHGVLDTRTSSPSEGYLMLFNVSKKLITYNVLLENKNSSGYPVISNNKIYNDVGGAIECYNLSTGKLIWSKNLSTSFLFSGIEVSDNKVFAGGENGIFYCLDAETGNIIWQISNVSGGSRKPFVMNGVVYFTRTYLYAVDIQNGQVLWKRECPEQAQNGSVYFFGRVTGSEGKIYVQSYKSAYCYKAAR